MFGHFCRVAAVGGFYVSKILAQDVGLGGRSRFIEQLQRQGGRASPRRPLEGAPAAAEAAAKPAAPPAPPPEVKVDHLAASKAALAAAKTPDDLKKALHEAFLAVDAVKAEAGKDPSELGDCPEKDALSAAKDAFANPKAEIAWHGCP